MGKNRISELDIFRGICILGVFVSHIYFDLSEIFGLALPMPEVLLLLFQYGGILFVVLSGICVTLGSHSVRRGLIVLGCGLLITVVTLIFGEIAGTDTANVLFGVLHLLGVCMLLYPLLRPLPTWALFVFGVLAVGLGYWFETLTVTAWWLFPLGLTAPGFYSADFWPIFPILAFSCWALYWGGRPTGKKNAPDSQTQGKGRFLCLVGRHSLVLYLAQQPSLWVHFIFSNGSSSDSGRKERAGGGAGR